MPTLKLYQVDAFTQTVFQGNPAAVIPLDAWLPDAVLQNIAIENNLSETAFFVSDGGGYHLRWFTPIHEVPLCGHATLAAAYVLFYELGYELPTLRFRSQLSDLMVTHTGDQLTLDFPAISYEHLDEYPDILNQAFGKEPAQVWVAHEDMNYYLIYDDADFIRSVEPDLALVEQVHPYGVAISARGESSDCVSRYFAPSYGIPEDPVTGSIHCVLVPYWARVLGQKYIHAVQASARGGELFCEDKGERVALSGYAVKYLEGTIRY